MAKSPFDLSPRLLSPRRKNKFGAVPVIVDGVRFASRAEAKRHAYLQVMQRAGLISDLKLQPRFPLVVNGIKVGTYVADFSYVDKERGHVVEDVKSPATRTNVFLLKKRLMLACHGIDVSEILC
jgi:hypothetical protein